MTMRATRNWRHQDQPGGLRPASELARCPGRMRKHSSRLATSTAITTIGSTAIIWPMVSPISRIGAKAASVVDIAAITGVNIMLTPFSAAVCGSSPICSRVAVCSPTTMASSTMMPSIMISENSDIMLIVWPEAYMKPIVASIATGMPAATQKAMRALRNRNRIATTTSSPPSPFLTSSQIRAESASEATS
jgi:hypothetical protein